MNDICCLSYTVLYAKRYTFCGTHRIICVSHFVRYYICSMTFVGCCIVSKQVRDDAKMHTCIGYRFCSMLACLEWRGSFRRCAIV